MPRRRRSRRVVSRARKSRGSPRRHRRSSRKGSKPSRRGSHLTRSQIVKALMPKMHTRLVTTGQITTGQVLGSALVVAGTASTGLYGLTEFRFHNLADLIALKNNYDATMGNQLLQSLALSSTTGSNDWSRYRLKTRCTSRVSNTTGTTITVDFLRFKTLRNMVDNLNIHAGVFPPIRAGAANPDAIFGGSPVVLAQDMYNKQAPADLTVGGDIRSLDEDFWKQRDFRRFYKLIGKSSVTMSHGQSVEFKWALPSISWSLFELNELISNVAAVAGMYIADKTFFTVWRIRGALGALTATGNTQATTAISTAIIATDRAYSITHTPVLGDVTKKFVNNDWVQQGTQVFVNNEYGTGATLAPMTTAI